MIVTPHHRAHVAAMASAMPEPRIDQATAIATLTSLFPEENPALIRQLVERSGVEECYLAPTPEQVSDRKSFTDRNLAYASTAVELAARACHTALDRAQFPARDVEARSMSHAPASAFPRSISRSPRGSASGPTCDTLPPNSPNAEPSSDSEVRSQCP